MTWLVAGCNGYIGRHVVSELLKQDIAVVGIDRDDAPFFFLPQHSERFVYLPMDIAHDNPESLCQKLKDLDITSVIHLAALKSVSESFEKAELYALVNEIGTLNVLRLSHLLNVKRFIFASSAAVYGQVDSSKPIEENLGTFPISPYGVSKLNAEKIVEEFCAKFEMTGFILRFFNVAGGEKSSFMETSGPNIFPAIFNAVKQKSSFNVFGNKFMTVDGTCERDYIHVVDVANAICQVGLTRKFFQTSKSYVYNLGSGKGVSVLTVINLFKQHLGEKLQFRITDARFGDAGCVISNTNQFKSEFSWEPKLTIERMVADYLALL